MSVGRDLGSSPDRNMRCDLRVGGGAFFFISFYFLSIRARACLPGRPCSLPFSLGGEGQDCNVQTRCVGLVMGCLRSLTLARTVGQGWRPEARRRLDEGGESAEGITSVT